MTTQVLTEEQTARMRRTVELMGRLLVARKDGKAIETKINGYWGWIPDRERVPRGQDPNSGALIPMRMQDFTEHLLGRRCMGTYLLDQDSMVKFLAFDLDLTKSGRFLIVREIEELETVIRDMTPEEVSAQLELDLQHGNLEEALHQPHLPAHRWSRIILSTTAWIVVGFVRQILGLESLAVLTGGGMHVLVPFPDLVPAADARRMGREVMDAAKWQPLKGDNFFAVGDEGSGITVEVFPKQDTNQGFGNLIRLPLGWHGGAQRRTTFVNTADLSGLPWEFAKGDPIAEMERVAQSLGLG